MTTSDVRIGGSVVEYDASWRPYKQPDWFDNLYNKLKVIFGKQIKKSCKDNTDKV